MLTVNPNTNAIEITRGDDQDVVFTVVTSAGAVQDITGWAFSFTVKEDIDDDIADAIFQKTTGGSGIALTTPLSGILTVTIAAADTNAVAGKHIYDLQGMDGSGNIRTVALASFTVRKDVTTVGTAGQPSAGLIPFPGSISIDGALYMKDLGVGADAGKYWKWTMVDGDLTRSVASSASIPF